MSFPPTESFWKICSIASVRWNWKKSRNPNRPGGHQLHVSTQRRRGAENGTYKQNSILLCGLRKYALRAVRRFCARRAHREKQKAQTSRPSRSTGLVFTPFVSLDVAASRPRNRRAALRLCVKSSPFSLVSREALFTSHCGGERPFPRWQDTT